MTSTSSKKSFGPVKRSNSRTHAHTPSCRYFACRRGIGHVGMGAATHTTQNWAHFQLIAGIRAPTAIECRLKLNHVRNTERSTDSHGLRVILTPNTNTRHNVCPLVDNSPLCWYATGVFVAGTRRIPCRGLDTNTCLPPHKATLSAVLPTLLPTLVLVPRRFASRVVDNKQNVLSEQQY